MSCRPSRNGVRELRAGAVKARSAAPAAAEHSEAVLTAPSTAPEFEHVMDSLHTRTKEIVNAATISSFVLLRFFRDNEARSRRTTHTLLRHRQAVV